LRLLIFDVDGTLYDQGRLRHQLLPRLAAYCLLHPLQGWRAARILSAWRRSLEMLRQSEGRLRIPETQMEATVRATGVSARAVKDVLNRWFYAAPLPLLASCVRPGLLRLLDEAASRGVQCAVLSDYEATAKLQAMGLAGRFQAVVSSSDPRVQTYKPDPAGIRVLLDELGVAPSEALYLGDRLDVDGGAARAAGVGFVLIDGRGGGFDEVDWSGSADE
jgi:phosphoglycolate phosphatase/putative hydrolase of the HAD superfamily